MNKTRRKPGWAWALLLSTTLGAVSASAADLYRPGESAALIADRRAQGIGDVVTILVYENSSARHATDTTADARVKADGRYDSPTTGDRSYGLGLGNSRDGGGRTQRSGNVLAQLSATVIAVTPNGDLLVSGEQSINVNREITRIRVSGRVRPSDIGHDNVVLSSRVADAQIDYVGEGDLARRSRPGLISWLLSFFRLW